LIPSTISAKRSYSGSDLSKKTWTLSGQILTLEPPPTTELTTFFKLFKFAKRTCTSRLDLGRVEWTKKS